jgi:hypothetical protein
LCTFYLLPVALAHRANTSVGVLHDVFIDVSHNEILPLSYSFHFLCKQYLYLSCERLHMAGLDDCNILQPGHLVESRLGGTHDSISVQNLSSHDFACSSNQAMSHVTKEHLARRDLRQTRVSRGTRYLYNSGGSRSVNVWSGWFRP